MLQLDAEPYSLGVRHFLPEAQYNPQSSSSDSGPLFSVFSPLAQHHNAATSFAPSDRAVPTSTKTNTNTAAAASSSTSSVNLLGMGGLSAIAYKPTAANFSSRTAMNPLPIPSLLTVPTSSSFLSSFATSSSSIPTYVYNNNDSNNNNNIAEGKKARGDEEEGRSPTATSTSLLADVSLAQNPRLIVALERDASLAGDGGAPTRQNGRPRRWGDNSDDDDGGGEREGNLPRNGSGGNHYYHHRRQIGPIRGVSRVPTLVRPVSERLKTLCIFRDGNGWCFGATETSPVLATLRSHLVDEEVPWGDEQN